MTHALCVFDAGARGFDGIADTTSGVRRPHVDAGLLADDFELLHGVRSLQVGRDEQRHVSLLFQPATEFASQRGLTGTLQTGQHHDSRRRLRKMDRASLAAENGDELLVDDFDDLLRRVERLRHLRAASSLLDRGDELAYDRQRDVGLEQCNADLARGRVDVGLGQPPLAAQRLEDRFEAVGEGVEHQALHTSWPPHPHHQPNFGIPPTTFGRPTRRVAVGAIPKSDGQGAAAVSLAGSTWTPPPAYIASIASV